MKRIIFFLLFVLISLSDCMRQSDFCIIPNENFSYCYGNQSYNCANFVCAKNQYSCHLLSLFSGLKGENKASYELFIDRIKNCSEKEPINNNTYEWNEDEVCLNTKDCTKSSIRRTWSTKIKRNECKCIGKYSFRCNSDYCGLNERACDGLIKKSFKLIKKCDYSKIKLILYNKNF